MTPPDIRLPIILVSSLCALLFLPKQGEGKPAYVGYNFYASGNTCYLKDMNNVVIHTWTSSYYVASHAYLLRDSSVLFPCIDNVDAGDGRWSGLIALPGGRFQIIKWDGTVAWDFPYHGTKYVPHHDCCPCYYTNDIKEMPSVFVVVATKEADNTIAEKIVEIQPTGPKSAAIKWEWRAYDHLVKNGANQPGLLDINKGGAMAGGDAASGGTGAEWLHANHVRYNPVLDQIVVSMKLLNEIIILDHSTTTAQAATHSGGKYGKGGDVLYRWGNPANYGCPGPQRLFGQHAACWIPNFMPGTRKPLPGAGDVLIINNETKTGVQLALPGTGGVYPWAPDTAYAPAEAKWEISIPSMGGNEGSMQRLPNGNTLVCFGISSTGVTEFDAQGKIVWKMDATAAEFFRYDSNYLGSTLLDTGEAPDGIVDRFIRPGKKGKAPVRFRIFNDRVRVSYCDNSAIGAEVSVYSADGRNVLRETVSGGEFVWRFGTKGAGLYFIRVFDGGRVAMERMMVF